jgi:hypothetical protein
VRAVVHRLLALGDGLAKVVEAAVAGDPVQPRPHVDRPRVGEHRRVGVREHLLKHVLGVLGRAEHVTAERQQARVIAIEQRLEGTVVPGADQRDQALVALQTQQGRATGEQAGAACVSEG